jgi:hypothetical protein
MSLNAIQGKVSQVMETNTVVSSLIQVAVGVVAVVIAYYLSLAVMRQDALAALEYGRGHGRDPKQTTDIMDGFLESSLLARTRYNTVNPQSRTFVPIPKSFNRMGGAQFTYQLWLYLGDTHSSTVRNKDIFLRGDDRKYSFRKKEAVLAEGVAPRVVEEDTDRIVKCPRLRFGPRFSDLVLEFNTQDDVNHKVNISAQESDTDLSVRHNLMGMMHKKWVLLTFTFEDNMPINDFENGVLVRFFVNDIMYHTHRVNSSLRQNSGHLYLFPGGEIKGCRIANLRYYNYAVGYDEVRDTFRKGRPTYRSTMGQEPIGDPMYLSEGNKVDIHNR